MMIDIDSATSMFIWAAKRSLQLGLQTSTGGNISIRLNEARFLTKPTGKGLADCTAADLVVIDEKGRVIQGKTRPTKEIEVHLSMFEVRLQIRAIVHYHSPYATAYACRNQSLPLPTVHSKRILKTVPMLSEYTEGSSELAAAASDACADANVMGFLMANHGLVALGESLEQAQYHAELMEESAKIGWLAQSIP